MSTQANVKTFFDQDTFTYTHILIDPNTKACAIVDSVKNYDAKSGRTTTESADEIVAYVQQNQLTVTWHLETHVHADHLSAAPYLKEKLGGKIAIGDQVQTVQKTFQSIFNIGDDFCTNGCQFDVLLSDGDHFQIGDLTAEVIHTPGHTPACVTFLVGDKAFVGDTIFMPDMGTARCDFPGGDASTLYHSIQKILSLPDETQLYMCHDYAPNGRDYSYLTTVKEQKENNIHVGTKVSSQQFKTMRTLRDQELEMPALIVPSVQVNMRAGYLPPKEANGVSYLKVPLNVL